MTDKEIVQALRCTSTPGGPSGECEKCPYWKKKRLNEQLKEKLGTDTWTSCDVDKVGMDAADLIERLTAENEALREKVPQWISVEDADELPEWGQRVLITDGVFVGEGFLTGKVFFGCSESSRWKRYDNTPWKKSMKTEITHWMPLPGTPEEGEKHETMHNKA